MIALILKSVLLLALAIGLAIAGALHYQAGWPWLLALPVGLLAPSASHAALLALEFALTLWLGRHAQLPADARRYELGGAFRAWLTEIPVAIRVFCWRMPFFGARKLVSGNDPDRIPVLLVHGYFCNQAMFAPLAQHLADAGHRVESLNLEPVFGSIEAYPALIDSAIRDALEGTSHRKIALIGHSMGGIAIRAYLRRYGLDQVGPVITLGSPHQGTALARVGHTEIVRQLSPGNPWLLQLEADEDPTMYRRFTVVLSEHDNIVTPQRSQTLPGARTVAFTGLGHVDLACHPAVWSVIEDGLGETRLPAEPLTPWQSADGLA